MAPLNKEEVLLMQEDVLVYGFERAGLPYYHEEPGNVRRLFTPSVGEAVLRFRCSNERSYQFNVRQHALKKLLEPSAQAIRNFSRLQVENIFRSDEPGYMKFFRYLAFTLDLSVFAHRYEKIQLMNPVFSDCGIVFDTYLSTKEELPFWKCFMSLCNTVLRNSSPQGQPPHLFRNPAVRWDPRDPTFNPDDPKFAWELPYLGLSWDHPILMPDKYALSKILRAKRDAEEAAAKSGQDDSNVVVESMNLDAKTSSLGDSSQSTSIDSINTSSDSAANSPRKARNAPEDSKKVGTGAPSDAGSNVATGAPSDADSKVGSDNKESDPDDSNRRLEDLDPFELILAAMQWEIADQVTEKSFKNPPLD